MALIRFMLATGLRVSETVDLGLGDLALTNRIALVRHGKGDNGVGGHACTDAALRRGKRAAFALRHVFGLNGDIPVPANYDNDSADDIAVFRPSVGGWYVQGQSPVFHGLNGDVPVPADYDGNGRDDIAKCRSRFPTPSTGPSPSRGHSAGPAVSWQRCGGWKPTR